MSKSNTLKLKAATATSAEQVKPSCIVSPKPINVYGYFDRIQFWLKLPIGDAQIEHLKRQCGKGGIYVENRRARFNPKYVQRIELKQPTKSALTWLSHRQDAFINVVEVALDLVFETLLDRDATKELFDKHFIRSWHRKDQQIVFLKRQADGAPERIYNFSRAQTRYDATGWKANSTVIYKESHTRVTGELNCVHIEWRLKGAKSVCNAGFKTGNDLLRFDHRSFWKKKLKLSYIDPERLGRYLRNKATKGKTKSSQIQKDRFGIVRNFDRKLGMIILNSANTIQELLDEYKQPFRLEKIIEALPVNSYLPT